MPAPKSIAVLGGTLLGTEVAAETVYFQDFATITGSNPDSWTASVGTASVSAAMLRLLVTFPNQTFEARTSRTFTVEEGRSYTLTASARNAASNSAGFVQVDGGTPVALGGTVFAPVSVTFTAASSAALVTLGGTSYWDDITLTRDPYPATPALPLDLVDAEITLDDSRAPYVEARLTVHTPAESALEQIDPRDGLRVQLDAELSWVEPGGRTLQARSFDLLLHERTVDHEAGTVELVLESDEALLIDGGNVGPTVDAGAEAHQASLRGIVDYVLAKHDAELEPGTDDADFTLTEDGRDADALKQAPGVTDWDFLDPLVRTAGLRLFCDEQRAWRLVNPATYRVDGETRVSEGINATRGDDTISLQATRPDGSPVWYTGVVVVYRWTDADGVQQVAYDPAGTPQKLYRIELNRPYPGPGLAAARLAQATGRGRVQELEALADLGATPGQTLVSTMPATPIQLGVVSAVTWYWAAEGDRHDLMTIRSRGLTDTPETAWYFAEGEWGEVAGIGWDDITTGGQ